MDELDVAAGGARELLEILVIDLDLHIGLRFRHKSNLLEMAFVVDIGLDAGLLKALFQTFRLGRFVEGRNRDHRV